MTPTPPIIHTAYIRVQGDLSVGIPHGDFTMTMYVDTADWDCQQLQQLSENIRQLYVMAHGEPASVTFDYEVAAREARESVMP